METVFARIANQLRAAAWLRRGMLGLASVGAVTAGVLSVTWAPDTGAPVWVAGLHIAALVLAGAIPLILSMGERSPAELVEEIGGLTRRLGEEQEARRTAEEESEAARQAYRRAVVLFETARAITEASDAVLLAPAADRRAVAERQLLAILDLLIERKGGLFGMKDERWTFGVYLPDGERLDMRVARRWSRESEAQSHRRWLPGEGHVGQAYKLGRELVCRDSRDPQLSGFLAADGDNFRDYDRDLYVSFASVPIMIGAQNTPLGVLVATSDQSGRFAHVTDDGSPDTVEPLRIAANVMATILSLIA